MKRFLFIGLLLAPAVAGARTPHPFPLDEMGRLLAEWQGLQNGIEQQSQLPQHLDDELQKLLEQSEALDKLRAAYEQDCASPTTTDAKVACQARSADINKRFSDWNQRREDLKSSSDRAAGMRDRQRTLLSRMSELRNDLEEDSRLAICKKETSIERFYACARDAAKPAAPSVLPVTAAPALPVPLQVPVATVTAPVIIPPAVVIPAAATTPPPAAASQPLIGISTMTISEAYREALTSRIARLKKARGILGDHNNSMWELNWYRLRDEARIANDPLLWSALDALLQELEQVHWSAEQNQETARAMALQPVWTQVSLQRRAMERLIASGDGPEREILKKSIASMNQLDLAQQAATATDMLTRLHDAAAAVYASHQRNQARNDHGEVWNRLYDASLLLGQITGLFADLTAHLAARPPGGPSRSAEAARLLASIADEDQQFRRLSDRSTGALQKKIEVDQKIADLESEQNRP